VQPERSPGIDMGRLDVAFGEIAALSELVKHHFFESGNDHGAYFNYTFDTPDAAKLWSRI
jgi:hypothetical protein